MESLGAFWPVGVAGRESRMAGDREVKEVGATLHPLIPRRVRYRVGDQKNGCRKGPAAVQPSTTRRPAPALGARENRWGQPMPPTKDDSASGATTPVAPMSCDDRSGQSHDNGRKVGHSASPRKAFVQSYELLTEFANFANLESLSMRPPF